MHGGLGEEDDRVSVFIMEGKSIPSKWRMLGGGEGGR